MREISVIATSATGFGLSDWAVLAAYFMLLVGSGVWLSKRQKGTEDYFLAGRRMPAWAVAVSVLASSLSAATFLGAPEQAFGGDLTYLSANLGVIVAALLVAAFFVPAYYRQGVTTVYELLGKRYGPAAKLAGSWTFMIGRVFASGARVYIAAHALSFVVFGDVEAGHLLIAVWTLSFVGIVYTLGGGIETVIWTDVVQTAVFIVAVIAAVVILLVKIPAPIDEIVSALSSPAPDAPSKLRLISVSTDPSAEFTLWTALTGFMLLNLAAYGTDHDLVQRMLTCRTPLEGSRSVIIAMLISIPTVLLFMVVGLLLWVFYTRPELMGGAIPPAQVTGGKEVLLRFITQEMPPGMSGLMIAGLFAVGLGSLDSALNAMSATFVNDAYRPHRPGRSERHYLLVGRIGVVVWGVMLGGFASLCIIWQQSGQETFLNFALSVMTFAYSGLLAVFVAALFTRRGSAAGVVLAIITGFAVTTALNPGLTKLAGAPWAEQLKQLAWPWRMVLATAAAFIVCMCFRRSGAGSGVASGPDAGPAYALGR